VHGVTRSGESPTWVGGRIAAAGEGGVIHPVSARSRFVPAVRWVDVLILPQRDSGVNCQMAPGCAPSGSCR
jgi:hypothetical protein